VLILAFAALFVPATLPVLAAAAAFAAAVALVAWRNLARFHHTLEETVARVLGGEEKEKGQLLDKVLQRYPWGVRSTAVAIPPDSPVARRTLQGSRIAELSGAMVAVLHRRGRETVNPGPDTLLLPGDTLVLMGDPNQLARAEALIVAHGEALRMTIQSKQAVVAEVRLEAASPWVGRSLEQVDLRANTGTLVAGVWPRGATRPIDYDGTRTMQPGDRLLLVGTPLQVERATAAARPPGTDPAAGDEEA
jgi:Trk K+ transport system NAD-binding subunit